MPRWDGCAAYKTRHPEREQRFLELIAARGVCARPVPRIDAAATRSHGVEAEAEARAELPCVDADNDGLGIDAVRLCVLHLLPCGPVVSAAS